MDDINCMISELNKRFEMKDLAEARLCLGLQTSRNRKSENCSCPEVTILNQY